VPVRSRETAMSLFGRTLIREAECAKSMRSGADEREWIPWLEDGNKTPQEHAKPRNKERGR
jgi:hypothetical protein